MRIEFCTSFARASDQYAPFMQSWEKNNSKQRLHVFYEGGLHGVSAVSNNQVVMHSLDEDMDRTAFLNKYGYMPVANGKVGDKAYFQFQAIKFCHKVFAQSFRVPICDWWIWLDGDIEFTKPFDKDLFEEVLPSDGLWSVLDRKRLPETGFLAWKVAHPVARASLDALRRLYVTGEIFRLPQWDDCTAFRHIINNGFSLWTDGLNNICEGLPEQEIGDHPWPKTILGEYMVHKKGPARKAA